MHELVDLLRRPSTWANDAAVLRPMTRVYLALLVLGVSALGSFAIGYFGARRVKRRAGEMSERGTRTLTRLRRAAMSFLVSAGVYAAVAITPLPPQIDAALRGVVFVVLAYCGARLVIHLTSLVIIASLSQVDDEERARVEREYVPLVDKLMTLAVSLVFVVVVAKYFGRDLTQVVAALGVGSLAIGLAAQQTLGNMIAGFVLLVDRPFRPGDRIRLASGEIGEVRNIGVRSTSIRLLDNNRLVVPNAELVNSRVVNYAAHTTHSDVRVTVAAGSDVERVMAVLTEVARAEPRLRAPFVRLTNVSDRGLELTLGFDSTVPTDNPVLEAEVRRAIVRRFAEEKIVIPDAYSVPPGRAT